MDETDRTELRDRILGEIRGSGPVSFARFMELALYDPVDGFYARPRVGEEEDFVTSPHVSPVFAELLARQLAESWEALGRPRRFTVVELGAGDGTLAEGLLAALQDVPELADAAGYVGVERTPGQRAALEARGLRAAESLTEVGSFEGCVIANEVLDNLPFHRLRRRHDRTLEVLVGAEGDRLVEAEAEPFRAALAALGRPLEEGEERPVSLAALALVREVAEMMTKGYAFFLDYAGPGPVHAYRDHRVLAEVLEEPGSRDITAGVDLERIATEAHGSGLQVWGPVTQRAALLGLGYRLWSSGVRARQSEAEAAGDQRAALKYHDARSRGSILVDESKLGGLALLALGAEGLPPPEAVRR